MKMQFQAVNAVRQAWLFLLELTNQQTYILVADADGIPMHETGEDTGIWRGQIWGGGTIEVPFSQVFHMARYKVTTFNGQTSKTEIVHGEARMEKIIEKATNPETGEVGGNIRSIEEVGKPDNRVTKRVEPEGW
jgi:hypothetical protein